MTNTMTNPQFDYSILSTDEVSKIRHYEDELARSRKRVTKEVIKHGEILHNVQQVLSNHRGGIFQAWLNSMGISRQTAYNAINSFSAFGYCPNLDNLEVSAMYVLAKNGKAKKKALRLIGKGVKVTHAMAQSLVGEAGGAIEPPPEMQVVEDSGLEGEDDPFDLGEEEEEGDPFDVDGELGSEGTTPDDEEEEAPWPPGGGTDEPGGAGGGSGGGKPKEPEWKVLKRKAVKTIEAGIRAVDDLNREKRIPNRHRRAHEHLRPLLDLVAEWGS